MILELGTQLVKFINVGMYESDISPENTINDESFDWDNFDAEKYTEFIFECAREIFDNHYLPHIKSIGLNIESGEAIRIQSPKFYNYGSDELYFDIELGTTLKEAWENYRTTIDEGDLDRFMRTSFQSYDGFISFMPGNIEELMELIENGEDDERAIAVLLSYDLAHDEENYQMYFIDAIEDKIHGYEFSSSDNVSEKFLKTFESWGKK